MTESTRPRRQESGPFAIYDAIGRKTLRRLGLADYLLEIARSEPARLRRVPSKAIAEEGEDDAGPFSFVACPCGMRPVARAELLKCGGCERNYVRFEHGAVFVVYAGAVPALVKSGDQRDEDGGIGGNHADHRDGEGAP